jgi:Holliday junction resolvase RusA-like endonuclease
MTAADNPVTVIVPGPPVAKGRPRMTRKGQPYTPAATRAFEAAVRWSAAAAMRGRAIITGPVKLTALFELPIPRSWSKARAAAAVVGDVLPAGRPDLDNFIKAGLDALNGVVLADDGLVVEIQARKRFSATPKVVMTVATLCGSNGICAVVEGKGSAK